MIAISLETNLKCLFFRTVLQKYVKPKSEDVCSYMVIVLAAP